MSYLFNHSFVLLAYNLRRKLTLRSISLVLLPDHLDASASFSTRKTSPTLHTAASVTMSFIGHPEKRTRYELSRHRCCLTLTSATISTTAYRAMLASNATPRSAFLTERAPQVLVRVGGCRTTKIQAYLCGVQQTQRGVRFSDMLVLVAIFFWVERKLSSLHR